MENRHPYPPWEGSQPSDIGSNYPQSSFNADTPFHSMDANAAAPDGNHAWAWNTSQMFCPPPRPDHFQHPPVHQFNQFEPPPHMGYPPPTVFNPGILPPPGPGIHESPGPEIHPPTGGVFPTPTVPPVPLPGPRFWSAATLSTHNQGRIESYYQYKKYFQKTIKKPTLNPFVMKMPEDEVTIQRREDEKWVKQFLQSNEIVMKNDIKPQSNEVDICDIKNRLYSTAQLVFQLSTLCEKLKLNVNHQSQKSWSRSYVKALNMKQDIQRQMKVISDTALLEKMIKKMSAITKKRNSKQRAKQRRVIEEHERQAQNDEKDVAAEKWRLKKVLVDEEKKKEEELKRNADTVLSDVRKKISDVNRMLHFMKSLEKLRKLRKDAASRKGISIDQQAEENFNNILAELREVAKKYSGVYSAEERVLIVMLEGVQEEERKKDLESRWQKEKMRQQQMRLKVNTMLFGDDTPADPVMQDFQKFYTKAETSLEGLVYIRFLWDRYLVPVDHPEGSSVPQEWVIPTVPTDEAWASALSSE